MEKSNPKAKYTANFSRDAEAQLKELVKQFSFTTLGDLEEIPPQTVAKLLSFLNNQLNITSLVQAHSYCATANDHTSLSAINFDLAQLLKIVNKLPEVQPAIKPLITELISQHNVKVFYRCFTNEHSTIAKPALELLTQIVIFANGAFIEEFLENFDISIKSFGDLFHPTKTSVRLFNQNKAHLTVRAAMSKFWVALLSNASPLTRLDLLSNNKKVNLTWFKFLNQFDNAQTINKTLKFIDQKILEEEAYKKMTKCKLIGDFLLSKLAELMKIDAVKSDVFELLVKITTNEEKGLVFHDYRNWFANVPAQCLENTYFNNGGVQISVGEQKFKINNKIIYNLLISLKPWTDTLQVKLVEAALAAAPELSAPYTAHLFFSNGANDPKLTSFYIGQTLLLTKIVQLPIPKEFASMTKKYIETSSGETASNSQSPSSYFNTKILMEVVCPSSLTKSAIQKGLTAPEQLIRHLTSQLVISVLQKYFKLSKLLSMNENSVLAPIRNELQESLSNLKLPDPSVFVGITNECLKAEAVNKLLLLNYMKAAEYYYLALNIIVPLQLQGFNKIVGIDLGNEVGSSKVQKDKLSDIDLLMFNTYLSLTAATSINNQQNKWWNIAKGSKNTLFTAFAKLPFDLQFQEEDGKTVIDNDLVMKVIEVLANFLEDTMAFEDFRLESSSVMYSQTWAIVCSFLKSFNKLSKSEGSDANIDAICKVLDESISRAIKTPYKYFDVVSKKGKEIGIDGRLSAFYVTLCEQSKFVKDENKDAVFEWIEDLSTYLFLIGEPLPLMTAIFREYCGSDIKFDCGTFEEYVKSTDLLKGVSLSFSLVSFTPLEKLANHISSMIPKTDVEIVAVLSRLNTIMASPLSLEKVEEPILGLIDILDGYLVQKYSTLTDDDVTVTNCQLLHKKFWATFMITHDECARDHRDITMTKKYFIMSVFNEVFKNLWDICANTVLRDSMREVVFDLLSDPEISTFAFRRLSEFIWVLSDDQLSKLIVEKQTMDETLLIDTAVKRSLQLSGESVFKFVNAVNSKEVESTTAKKFGLLTKNCKFDGLQVQEFIELLKVSKCQELYFSILENACEHDSSNFDIICHSIDPLFDTIADHLEGFQFLQFLSLSNESYRAKLYEVAAKNVNGMISGENKFDISLNTYLKSFALYLQVTDENLETIKGSLNTLTSIDDVMNTANLIFSPEMTSIIFSTHKLNSDSGLIKSWLHRATLYITKIFAEKSEEYLTKEFVAFLSCLRESLDASMWKFVAKNMINSQLEVIFSRPWVGHVDVLKYCTWIVQTGSKNVIESIKLVNILLTNENNVFFWNSRDEEAKYYTAMILSLLFQMNIKQLCSYNLVFKLVKMYRGTGSASDLVLKDLLMHIENENGQSWVQYVSNWDFVDDWGSENAATDMEVPELVIDTPGVSDALTVNLHKSILEHTIRLFNPLSHSVRMVELEKTITSQKQDFRKIENFYELKKMNAEELEHTVVYDIEFILLLIVNNDDLFKITEDSIEVNIRALIDAQLLQLVICGLAHEVSTVVEISKRIISSVMLTIEQDIKKIDEKKETKESSNEDKQIIASTFKERSAFKVYLGNLLYSYEVKKQAKISGEENVEAIPKLFIMMLSYLVPILANPGHFLYERAYRYILSGSKYRDYEIPMYKNIMTHFIKDEHTNASNDDADYYKQLQWILETLGKSITDKEDLKILRRNEVIEQLLNLTNSPFINDIMEDKIVHIFDKIVALENGADLLIRSFGLLSFSEGKENIIRNRKVWKKYSTLTMKSLIASDCSGKDKRARKWSSDDFGNVVKRICK